MIAVGLALTPALATTASAAPTNTAVAPAAAPGSSSAATGSSAATTGSSATAASPWSAPSDSPAPVATTPVDPTIDDPGDLTTALARFGGTATPGDAVRVADPAAPSASACTATATASGSWTCTGSVRSGPQQVFTVIDTTNAALHAVDAPASDVVTPPTVTPTAATTGGVSGSGLPGATVVLGVTGSSASRTTLVGADGAWYVSWSTGAGQLADGHVVMTATQTASTALGYRSDLASTASRPADVTIDRTAPSAPTVQSPGTGVRVRTQPITISGTGEAGDTVTAYIDSNPVCQATVNRSGWSCSTDGESIPVGTRQLVVGQRDPAGNFSPVSTAVQLTVAAAPADTPAAPGGGSSAGAPSSGSGTATGGGTSGSGGTSGGHGTSGSGAAGGSAAGGDPSAPPTGAAGGPASTGPDGTDGSAAAGSAADGSDADAHGAWSIATGYDGAVPTIQASVSLRTLVVALIGAGAFLALVAAPIGLAVRTTRGRGVPRRARLTGRNRTAAERATGDVAGVPTWVTLGLATAIASLLALLGTGVAAEPRYARLAIAVVLGTAVLTLGTVLATRWAAGTDRHTITYRLSPVLVTGAILACIVTRSLDLSPAVLLGVLVVPTARLGTGSGAIRRGRAVAGCGRNATWRTGTLLLLVAVGWVLHSAVTPDGFWGELVGEFAITLCVGGLGSLVTALVPVPGPAGAALWATSRIRYAVLASVGIGLAVAVYSGPVGNHVSLVAMLVVVVVSAAVGLVTWLWVRVVEPVLGG